MVSLGNDRRIDQDLLLDLKKLDESLKKNMYAVAVVNIIEDFLQRDIFLESLLFDKLAVLIGEEAARAVLFILDFNDLGIVDKIREAGLSENLCNFILNLLTKCGERYKDNQIKEYNPFILTKTDTHLYYVPRTGKVMYGLNFQRADGEAIHLESTFEDMFDLISRLFKDMLCSAMDTSEKIPFLRFEISKRNIDEVIKSLKEFKKYLHTRKSRRSK